MTATVQMKVTDYDHAWQTDLGCWGKSAARPLGEQFLSQMWWETCEMKIMIKVRPKKWWENPEWREECQLWLGGSPSLSPLSCRPHKLWKNQRTLLLVHITWTFFFCSCYNTKCRRMFDRTLQQHNKPANGQGMKQDAEERLDLSDRAHTFFRVISQETRPGCQNQGGLEKLKGVSLQTLDENFFPPIFVYYIKTHTHPLTSHWCLWKIGHQSVW